MADPQNFGLNYRIEVSDAFTTPLGKFKADVDEAEKSWRKFRNTLEGTASPRRSRTTEQAARNSERVADSTKKVTEAERELQRIRQRTEKDERALTDQRRIRARANQQAVQAELRSAERLAKAQALIARGRKDLVDPRTARELEKTNRGFRNLIDNLTSANSGANRISFTFRRLFGILAAFTIARKGIQGLNELIRSLVRTNAELETVEVGLAGVIAAVAEVRGLDGAVLGTADAFRASQEEASRQLRILRIEALNTTATFEELSEAFQIAVGPGLAAGLDLDQVRRFTVLISQAASAIGLAQNQLSEEVRSILGGTIRVQQTRIAAVLGITNEDVRRAREAGELFEFLSETFEAFGIAGVEAANTFTGLSRRIRDGLELVAREGGVGLFEAVKDSLRDFLDVLVEVDSQTGELTVNEDFIRIIRALSDALEESVARTREFVEGLSTEQLATFAGALGEILSTVGLIGAGLVQGILQGVDAVAQRVREISGFLRRIPILSDIFDAGGIRQTVAAITSLVVQFVALTTVLALTRRAAAALAIVFSALRIAGLVGSITGLVASLGALRVAFTGAAVSGGAAGLAGSLGLVARGLFRVVIPLVILIALLNNYDKILKELEGTTAYRSIGAGLQTIGNNARFALRFLFDVGTELEDLEEQYADTADSIGDFIDRTGQSGGTIASTLDAAGDSFKKLGEDLKGVFEDVTNAADAAFSDVANIAETESERAAREFNAQFFGVSQNLVALVERVFELGESLRTAIGLSSRVSQTAGADIANSINRAFAEAEQRAEDFGRAVTREIEEIDNGIEQLRSKISDLDGVDPEGALRAEGQLNGLIERRANLQVQLSNLRNAELAITATQVRRQLELANQEAARENSRNRILLNTERLIALNQNLSLSEQDRVRQAINAAALFQQEREDREAIAAASIAEAQARSQQITEALEGLREQAQLNGGLSDQQRDQVRALQEAKKEIDAQNAALLEGLAIQRQLDEVTKTRLENEAALAALQAESPGQFRVIEDLVESIGNRWELVSETILSSIQGFGDLAGSVIADAFDPTTDTDIQQRFGMFLKQIGQQIISELLRVAISLAVLNAISGGILGAVFGGIAGEFGRQRGRNFGFNEGGKIGGDAKRNARPSLAHMGARGFADGGRPAGLHPSDKIPIWAAEGEWVIRARAAAKAGMDAMAAINSGMFDPAALRAALGLSPSGRGRAAVRSAPKRGRGFNDGGQITDSIAGGAGGPNLAIIAPTEESVRRLFGGGGGKAALLDIIGENNQQIRGILGV